MKLAVIQCVNGAYSVIAEGITTEQAALVAFHDRAKILWNAPDVITGEVAIVDEQLDVYKGHKELITHEVAAAQPEPEPEPEEEEPTE